MTTTTTKATPTIAILGQPVRPCARRDERREGIGQNRGDDKRPDDVPGEPQDDRGTDDEGDERSSIRERPRVHRCYSTSVARRTPARNPR